MGNGFSRIGGAAFVAAGTLYLVLLILLIAAGGEPTTAQELLAKLASHAFLIRDVGLLFLVVELCLLAAFPILYVALRALNNTWSPVATVLAFVALTFDLMSGLLVYALPDLGRLHLSAESTAQPTHVAFADFLYGYIWKVETPFHVALLSLAVLIFSSVMLKGIFNKFTAYLGIIIGTIGVLAGMLGFFPIAVLWSIWFFPTGIGLYRLDPLSAHQHQPR